MTNILIVLGLLVGGALILSTILTPRSRTNVTAEYLSSSRKKSLEMDTKTEPEGVFFYLSEFEELLDRYGLPKDKPESFFELVNKVILEGKIYARESLLKIIKDESPDLKSKAEEFLKVYQNLIQTPPVLEFKLDPNKKDIHTPKIYISALKSWVAQFGLEKELEENPKQTFLNIIKKDLYHYGMNLILNRIKVYTKHLEKELASDNTENLKNLLEMIERELNELTLQ